jgi:peroxiredoxin
MPDLQESYAAGSGEFVVLAVNSEGTATNLATRLSEDFRDELGLTFSILLDSPGNDVFNQYRLRGLPDTFFIDRDGIIREAVVGPLTAKTLEEKLQSILK